MQKQNQALDKTDHKISNLWLGFAFGAITTSVVAFLLGTKKGREILKKLLELTENLEENILIVAEEIEETLIDKAEKLKTSAKEKPALGNILDKMKIKIA